MATLRRHLLPVALTRVALGVAVVALASPVGARSSAASPVSLDQAADLVRAGEFERATTSLQRFLESDPSNRRARELLAFAFESLGEFEAERELRGALAAEFPAEASLQSDYARALERSGREREALQQYRRARGLNLGRRDPQLEAAIERTSGRTAVEVGVPLTRMLDPDATASRFQAGTALPVGPRTSLSVSGSASRAESQRAPRSVRSEVLALTLVRGTRSGAWSVGPRLHSFSQFQGSREAFGLGGVVTGQLRLPPTFETEARAQYEVPWDEAAVTILEGGRSTAAEAHVHAHAFQRRLHVQVGARQRRLSVFEHGAATDVRVSADQSLWLAGGDLWLWTPGTAVRGQFLDEELLSPAPLASAVRLAYRHYDVTTRASEAFSQRIAIAPRAAADELSLVTTWASQGGRLGFELRGGVSRDALRDARSWSAGGAAIWAPTPRVRCALGWEEAAETSSGLVGRRRVERVSFHVDL